MEENKTKQELDALCEKIDSKLEESAQQVKDNLKHEVDNFKSNEIKDLLDKHNNIVDRLDAIEVIELNLKHLVMHLIKVNH